jgi:hypothetical protein
MTSNHAHPDGHEELFTRHGMACPIGCFGRHGTATRMKLAEFTARHGR